MIAAIVDGGALLQVVWISLACGLGVTAAYAVAIVGGSRAMELRRDGRGAEAAVFAIVGLVALGAVLVAIVAGIVALSDK
jgi:hypothetical protein